MIKSVIIGTSHMHVNEIALYISECKDMELIGVSDVPSALEEIPPLRYTPKWNLKNVTDNYCSVYYEDYKKMLDELKPDVAFILTENCQKPEVVNECAIRKVNVCIEKPIAVSLDEAKKIKKSVDENGIEAYVNWPVAWRPYLYKMKAALDNKVVGEPVKLRYINGHTGPLGKGAKHRGVTENAEEMTDEQRSKTWWHKERHGGGVYLDICCYGCYFSRWLMGKDAKGVISVGANLNTPFGDTHDNFGAIVRYDDKLSVLEGTWTTPRTVIPSGPMIICTEGVIECTGGAENAPDVRAFDIYGNPVEIPDVNVDEDMKNMPCHYARHIIEGKDIMEMLTLDVNIDVMAFLDGAIKSSKSLKEEKITF